jgi:hypothetical protein
MSKPIAHVWFNGRSNIGIVLALDEFNNEPKAWITTAVGMDEDDDIQHIMEWGSKFPVEEARSLIQKHGMIIDRKAWQELEWRDSVVNSTDREVGSGGGQ